MKDLPAEIVTEIAKQSFPGYNTTLALSHTCRGIRKVLLESKSLWTEINSCCLKKIRTFLKRSGSLPLGVTFKVSERDDFGVIGELTCQAERWKTLTLSADFNADYFNSPLMDWPELSGKLIVPNLESIRLVLEANGDGFSEDRSGNGTKRALTEQKFNLCISNWQVDKLKTMFLVNFIPTISGESPKSLTELFIDLGGEQSQEDFKLSRPLTVLKCLPSLRYLKFVLRENYSANSYFGYRTDLIHGNLKRLSIDLYLMSDSAKFIRSLKRFRFPALEDLEIVLRDPRNRNIHVGRGDYGEYSPSGVENLLQSLLKNVQAPGIKRLSISVGGSIISNETTGLKYYSIPFSLIPHLEEVNIHIDGLIPDFKEFIDVSSPISILRLAGHPFDNGGDTIRAYAPIIREYEGELYPKEVAFVYCGPKNEGLGRSLFQKPTTTIWDPYGEITQLPMFWVSRPQLEP